LGVGPRHFRGVVENASNRNHCFLLLSETAQD
jgi:hypothetical protein